MNVTNSLSKSRGIENLLLRIISIFNRFGITSKKFEYFLNRYSDVTAGLGCVPTFAITAVTLARHPKVVKELSQKGVEFAVHGYIHTDHKVLSVSELNRHFKKAINTFQKCQVPFQGFRMPFLRINGGTLDILSSLGFRYDSSHVVHWNVVNQADYPRQAWSQYERVLDFYSSRQAQQKLALPRLTDGLVEIPVSIPDDEILIDRLGVKDNEKITGVWQSILQKTYDRGELFTVQLHPERTVLCEKALVALLHQAREYQPSVWVATLGQITEWWQERAKFSFEINAEGGGRYRVKASCSERATILFKNCQPNVADSKWSGSYSSISARDFVLESPSRPVIGVSPDSSVAAVSFLKSEGFVVERSHRADGYGIYLNNLAQFTEAEERPLSEAIDKSAAPLLRYWRWPDRAGSALSITGDIDSITLIDFVLRIFENFVQNMRN